MATLEVEPQLSGPETVRKAPRVRTSTPILVWATIGALFMVSAAYIAGSWILGGRATPTPLGKDEPTSGEIAFNIGAQVAALVAVGVALFFVIRRCIRERRVTFDLMLMIAYVMLVQWDPVLNYVVPTFSYTSLMINFGSWTTDVPGWVSPRANLMPEPTAAIGIGFMWSAALCMLGCGFLRKFVMKRWPETGKLGIILWSVGFMAVMDLLIESVLCFGHNIAYFNTVGWLTLWQGTSHQFPIYEALVWGGFGWAPLMVLRFYLDDRGHSVVERGVDRLNVSYKTKVLLQILALGAVTNICYVSYNIVMIGISLQNDNDASAVYPTHLTNSLCGPENKCTTPGNGTPIPTGGKPASPSDVPGNGRTWVDVYFGR